jgi:hypothetical protein
MELVDLELGAGIKEGKEQGPGDHLARPFLVCS